MTDNEELPPNKRMRMENDNTTTIQFDSKSTKNNLQETTNPLPGFCENATEIPESQKNNTSTSGNCENGASMYVQNNGRQSVTLSDSTSRLETDDKSQDSTASIDQYNYVTKEELEKLKEFQVLDEVNEDDSKDEDSDASDNSEQLLDEEIEKMLEEGLPEDFKAAPKPKEKSYVTREKVVLQEKGINQFEVLPLDWLMVRHCSGMPVYMHRPTRVCTLAKPYFLGKGNTRRHEIPISAIPCLAYRRALEEEEKQKEIDKSIAEQIANGTWKEQENKTNAESKTNKVTKPSNEATKSITKDKLDESKENNELSEDKDKKEMKHQTEDQKLDVTDKDQTEPSSQTQESKLTESGTAKEINAEDFTSDDVVLNNDSNAGSNKDGCPYKDAARKPVVLPGGIVMPPPRVETVNTSWKTQHLTAEQVNDYCKKLFQFKNVKIMHFKRWADRRKYVKARKTLQYPALPEGTKLITIPAQNNGQDSNGKATKRDWVMNMNGCSYLSVFHEYVRRALHKQPVYEFKQLENAASPYQATVYIGGMQYGVGLGASKRAAKSAAARASIHILIPEMKEELDQHAKQSTGAEASSREPDFSFFDYVGITDPRIAEFCAATSEPSPHAILRTCLLRNFGAGDRHIETKMKKLEYQKIELTMTVGKHSATVVCKNKKQAKQRASQAILQALHPHIPSWGSLLRLYGSQSVKSCKEKKLEEQQITLLQDKAQQNEPNYAVLEKLRSEMRKLKERDEAVVPIGKLLVADDLPTHSGSMLNNVDL